MRIYRHSPTPSVSFLVQVKPVFRKGLGKVLVAMVFLPGPSPTPSLHPNRWDPAVESEPTYVPLRDLGLGRRVGFRGEKLPLLLALGGRAKDRCAHKHTEEVWRGKLQGTF